MHGEAAQPQAEQQGVSAVSPAISPQTLTPLPCALHSAMVCATSCSTAGCSGSYRCATDSSARSIASVYWIRSLVPIDRKSKYFRKMRSVRAAAGISIMAPTFTGP